jgi:hypothetical protein
MLKNIRNAILRRGVETAIHVGAETAAIATTKSFVQVFEVRLPTTIYVRATQSEVTVIHRPGNKVELSANLRASFGWELVAEQDDAGIYIVAKRKLVVGTLSSADFTLIVPPEANLVFNLTPGAVKFANINGKFNIVRPFEQIHDAEISRTSSR